ncbi:MAG: TRAP transporter small permease subunit [Desulfobacterales bacterium]|nr:MAG: TRAP transporter small permease subunit [Desulfobacterales bacterium]
MITLRKIFGIIDYINQHLSNLASLLFVPMTLIAVYEVIMRYLFNRPTIWAWDVNVQLFAVIVVFGAGNTLLQKGHVVMDIFILRLSERKRLIINMAVYIIFIVTMAIVVWQCGIFARRSIEIGERTSTLLSPPIYPLKTGIFIGVALFWLQAISLFIKDMAEFAATSRKEKLDDR